MFVNSAAENKLGQTSGVGNKLPTLRNCEYRGGSPWGMVLCGRCCARGQSGDEGAISSLACNDFRNAQ